MIKVEFYESKPLNIPMAYVVIAARYREKWLYVKHKERSTYEIPGGHIEKGEDFIAAAKRELYEETGAKEYDLHLISVYTVEREEQTSGGYLFFADVHELAGLPEYEIAEVVPFDAPPKDLTYPLIQPHLHNHVLKWMISHGSLK